ncbi:MAG: saccharopine dehydrogenase NADP-binding domain-containing protein [Deltaproteobacteria bacterium]|nr:saccharopine dehydrogenase NADP-binding domain-containing protein [Deltaproteobacteria bacterium]
MKKVLVLGAGLVAKPLVHYLLDKGYHVSVVTRTVSKAEKMIAGYKNADAQPLDLKDEDKLAEHVKGADLAVSLVPPPMHPVVAKMCIAHKKQMVTTSYVSDAMKALDGPAKEAGVTILNEIGVDPGIDHMSAMRIIDDVRKRGGKIVSFKSYCGGLPAPEDNTNPFGYKFSWAPRGVLVAGRNNAEYLLDGRVVKTPNAKLFRDMHMLQVDDFGEFEAYPNRDSISYIDVYGLQGIQTIFRGTLRNPGWCDCLHTFNRLGLLALEEIDCKGLTYAELMRKVVGAGPNDDLATFIARKLLIPAESLPIANLRWLGMLSDRKLEGDKISPLDAMGNLMFEKLAYGPHERDMIVMWHDFRAEFPGGKRERITSRMIDFGIKDGDSSMSRTVSLPAAIGVHMILNGKITARGVLRPVTADIYEPVLNELATMNIACKEATEHY